MTRSLMFALFLSVAAFVPAPAQELAPFGFRVNALGPSALTDMMRQLPPDVIDELEQRLPSPDDVAGVAVFLVSDMAKTVNGQIVWATAKGATTNTATGA